MLFKLCLNDFTKFSDTKNNNIFQNIKKIMVFLCVVFFQRIPRG